MSEWTSIIYRGFWDVPRVFLTHFRQQLLLFECLFDPALDDYPDTFQVYLMPETAEADLPTDWTTLSVRALQRLGEIPVDRVRFDPTQRKQIHSGILEELYAQRAAS